MANLTKQDMIWKAIEMGEKFIENGKNIPICCHLIHDAMNKKESTVLSFYSKEGMKAEYNKAVKYFNMMMEKTQTKESSIETAMELSANIDKELTAMENEVDACLSNMEEMEIALGMKPCPKCDDICEHDYEKTNIEWKCEHIAYEFYKACKYENGSPVEVLKIGSKEEIEPYVEQCTQNETIHATCNETPQTAKEMEIASTLTLSNEHDMSLDASESPVSTSTIEALVQDYLAQTIYTGLHTVEGSKGKCDGVATQLRTFLQSKGIPAKIVEGVHYLPKLQATAHKDWQEFKGKDQKFLAHVVVLVENTIIDLTGAQFNAANGTRIIYPMSTFQKEWKKITEPKGLNR